MNHAVILDASVVVKLFVAEEFSDLAAALVNDTLEAGLTILAPWHMRGEVANAIHKQWREGRITSDEVNQALDDFFDLPIIFLSSAELYRRVVLFARDNGQRTIYDSLYVMLAEMLGFEFWTDDRRLIESVQSNASSVRWLGNYQPARS